MGLGSFFFKEPQELNCGRAQQDANGSFSIGKEVDDAGENCLHASQRLFTEDLVRLWLL